MPQFNVLEAKRPLEDASWAGDVSGASERMFGDDIFDFHDGQLAAEGIVLLSRDEQAIKYTQESRLGHTATEETIDLIRKRIPPTFTEPASPSVRRSGLDLSWTGVGEDARRMLVARVGCEGQFKAERGALTGAINQALRKNLRWRHPERAVGIVLATVLTDDYISNKDLKRLGKISLPKSANAKGVLLGRTAVDIPQDAIPS